MADPSTLTPSPATHESSAISAPLPPPEEPAGIAARLARRSRASFHDHFHRNERVAFFSDGVFAIVVTLLVLELRVPHLANAADPVELRRAILGMSGQLVSFVLSFLFTVNLWVSHNLFFKILTRVDNVVLWVNNLFLLFVCFIPFPTAVIGEYPHNPAALVLFGLVWMAIATILFAMGRYAIASGLISEHVDLQRYRQVVRVLGVLLPFSAVPMLVAHAQPMLALGIYIAMAFVGIALSFWVKVAD